MFFFFTNLSHLFARSSHLSPRHPQPGTFPSPLPGGSRAPPRAKRCSLRPWGMGKPVRDVAKEPEPCRREISTPGAERRGRSLRLPRMAFGSLGQMNFGFAAPRQLKSSFGEGFDKSGWTDLLFPKQNQSLLFQWSL